MKDKIVLLDKNNNKVEFKVSGIFKFYKIYKLKTLISNHGYAFLDEEEADKAIKLGIFD